MLQMARSSRLSGRMLAPDTLAGRFVRYCFASVSGTAIDLAAFGLLVWGSLPAWIAAATGYTLGTVWHWQISSRIVFADRARAKGEGREKQQALFVASALLGLGLTTLIVSIAVQSGIPAIGAKIAAMCAAFTSVWLVRLLFVFANNEVQS
ncbi:MAG: GtrA family protein [Pseudomonadota bacterium]